MDELSLRWRAAQQPAVAAAVLVRARRLREAIDAILTANAVGITLPRDSMRLLNAELGLALANARLQPATAGFAWQWAESLEALDRPLWPVVRSAADLLTSDELAHVHKCAGDTCGWLFVDRSRNHSRRWCDMNECGNVAKVRRYRTRRKRES